MTNLLALYILNKSNLYFFIASVFLVGLCVSFELYVCAEASPIPGVFFTSVEGGQVIITVQPIDIQGVSVENGWAFQGRELMGPVITQPATAIDVSYIPEDNKVICVDIDDNLYLFYPTGHIVILESSPRGQPKWVLLADPMADISLTTSADVRSDVFR